MIDEDTFVLIWKAIMVSFCIPVSIRILRFFNEIRRFPKVRSGPVFDKAMDKLNKSAQRTKLAILLTIVAAMGFNLLLLQVLKYYAR